LHLLKAFRPLQWIKNGLIFIPCLFALQVSEFHNVAIDLIIVALSFCYMSSGIYLFNDLADRKSDAIHPIKKYRAIASGKVNPKLASLACFILLIGGIVLVGSVDPVLLIPSGIYITINCGYSLGLKTIVVLDLFSVTSGYVIRTVVGAMAINAEPSPWLYTTTGAAALFIVVGKRYAEMRLTDEHRRRAVLERYSFNLVTQLLTISAASALLSYTLYTVEKEMLLTLPSVAFGLFRYLYLLNTSKSAESPERLIIQDIPLILSVISWMIISAFILGEWYPQMM